MFTGLIQGLGQVIAIDRQGDGARFRIECPTLSPKEWAEGASISVSGCCLTALEIDAHGFSADLSQESLDRTTHGQREVGDYVNLEPALAVGDPLGGHYVTGHVDGLAKVLSVTPLDAGNHRVDIEVPQGFRRFIAPKGSVTLDGISLTVNEVSDTTEQTAFWINVIPHTWDVTTLGAAQPGYLLNFEIDLLARYLDRFHTVLD